MKLYPIPGGTWAGTEADWKKAMKARGLDPKNFPAKTREVPTAKGDLMEFLNFFAVDVYRTGDQADIVVGGQGEVDVEALRAKHNPDASPFLSASEVQAAYADALPDTTGDIYAEQALAQDLDTLFGSAPILHQLSLAVAAIDTAGSYLRDR